MTPERWRQIEKLYHSTLEREESQRAAFLKEACGGDDELRREVESLLAHGTRAGNLLETPVMEVAAKMFDEGPGKSLMGRRLGNYEIRSLLGVGGMGEVYRAHDSKLGREVALKVLPPAFTHDPERLARFKREARMLASLNHPNIAAIYGFEESGGRHFLVLELVPGQTLAERAAAGPLPVPEALTICGQVAEALEAAHAKAVIHRDLKPANIKVTPEGRVKVLDFGLAKAFAGDGSGSDLSTAPTLITMGTKPGAILGTPAYMSPEQARGKPVDKRTDIWAFGCLLYELLTGKRPFQGETVSDSIAAVLEREPDWQALPAAMPQKIRDLLRHCLENDMNRRLRDAGKGTAAGVQEQHKWRQQRNISRDRGPPGSDAPESEVVDRHDGQNHYGTLFRKKSDRGHEHQSEQPRPFAAAGGRPGLDVAKQAGQHAETGQQIGAANNIRDGFGENWMNGPHGGYRPGERRLAQQRQSQQIEECYVRRVQPEIHPVVSGGPRAAAEDRVIQQVRERRRGAVESGA